jgi:hypothetical protein
MQTGRYNVSFTGPAGARLGPFANKGGTVLTKLSYNSATRLHRYAMDVPPGIWLLGLKFTNTLGQVKNLKVVQPGIDPLNPPVFSPKYVALLKELHPNTLRLMQFTGTQNSQVSTWAQRSKPTDALQNKGVAWEHAIQLANAVGSNVWVNVPGRANDDYVRQLATLLKNNLRPDLNIYVEYSNEVWADIYDQARYNYTQAVQEVIADTRAGRPSDLNYDNRPVDTSVTDYHNANAMTWGDRRTVRRSKQISDIFRQVWTSSGQEDPINTRVRVVLGGQASRLSRFDNMFAYAYARLGAPSNYLYAIGVGPYFGMNIYNDRLVNGVWQTSKTPITVDEALDGMARSIASYESKPFYDNANALADQNGLRLVGYETGADTYGPFNIAAKKAASLDPRIKPLIERFLARWYSRGGDLTNWFTLGARSYDTAFGTWAITNDINRLNAPKIEAFKAVRDSVAPPVGG